MSESRRELRASALLELCGRVLVQDQLDAALALVLEHALAAAGTPAGQLSYTSGDRRSAAWRGVVSGPEALHRRTGPRGAQLELRMAESAHAERLAEKLLAAVAPALATLAELERTREASRQDALTGLLHIGAFRDLLDREIRRAERHDRALSLVLIDLDGFKIWNDERGHPAGDRLLCAFAECLGDDRRAGDWLGRCGGDEFGLLLPETDPRGAAQAALKLREQWQARGVGPRLPTFSAGIAGCPVDAWNADDLYAAADRNLYRAKRAGRDRVVGGDRPASTRRTRPPLRRDGPRD